MQIDIDYLSTAVVTLTPKFEAVAYMSEQDWRSFIVDASTQDSLEFQPFLKLYQEVRGQQLLPKGTFYLEAAKRLAGSSDPADKVIFEAVSLKAHLPDANQLQFYFPNENRALLEEKVETPDVKAIVACLDVIGPGEYLLNA